MNEVKITQSAKRISFANDDTLVVFVFQEGAWQVASYKFTNITLEHGATLAVWFACAIDRLAEHAQKIKGRSLAIRLCAEALIKSAKI